MIPLVIRASKWLKNLEELQDIAFIHLKKHNIEPEIRVSILDTIKYFFMGNPSSMTIDSDQEIIQKLNGSLNDIELQDMYLSIMRSLRRNYTFDFNIQSPELQKNWRSYSNSSAPYHEKKNEVIMLRESNRSIVLESEDIVHRMESRAAKRSSISPSLEIYHMLLTAYERSGTFDASRKAEALLRKLTDAQLSIESDDRRKNECLVFPEPSAVTFQIVLKAYARIHGSFEAAKGCERIIHLMRGYATAIDDVSLLPDILVYNTLLRSYKQSAFTHRRKEFSREPIASKALDILKNLETMQVANFESYALCVDILSSLNEVPYINKATQILSQMEALYYSGKIDKLPDTICFNRVIKNRLGKVAKVEEMIEIEGIMDKMVGLNDHTAMPDSMTFRHLFEGWQQVGKQISKSNAKMPGMHAEKLIARMESQFAGGNYFVQPDREAYFNVIKCWGACFQFDGAFERGYSILSRMKNLSQVGNSELSPQQHMYQVVMRMCCNVEKDKKKALALKTAFDCYNDIIESNSYPVSKTYELLLNCIANLAPENEQRYVITRQVFEAACNHGQVTASLLSVLARVSPQLMIDYDALPEHSSRAKSDKRR